MTLKINGERFEKVFEEVEEEFMSSEKKDNEKNIGNRKERNDYLFSRLDEQTLCRTGVLLSGYLGTTLFGFDVLMKSDNKKVSLRKIWGFFWGYFFGTF